MASDLQDLYVDNETQKILEKFACLDDGIYVISLFKIKVWCLVQFLVIFSEEELAYLY